MKRNKMAVIGLGNRLLADEGAGLVAIDLLREKLGHRHGSDRNQGQLTGKVDLVDAGTPGMNLLHQFAEREKIIFIDAGNCGLKPGQYTRFIPGEVHSRKEPKGFSLHEFDLIEFLEFARQMDMDRNVQVVIYCIQAAEMTMSEKLTPVVEKGLPHLVEDVYGEVKKGISDA
jgi:hydrogenase maturation protease